jgi:flagellar basal body-associated protein FliL
MSTETKPVDQATDKVTPASNVAAPAKSSFLGAIVRAVLPALLAAGAAYGGSRAALAAAHDAKEARGQEGEARPPGPTLPLEPFLVTLFDANRRPHPMKMTVAVEFDGSVKEDMRAYVPRIRDAILAHLRMLPYEEATNPDHVEKLRAELLERCRSAGAQGAGRVLVTDFVVQ